MLVNEGTNLPRSRGCPLANLGEGVGASIRTDPPASKCRLSNWCCVAEHTMKQNKGKERRRDERNETNLYRPQDPKKQNLSSDVQKGPDRNENNTETKTIQNIAQKTKTRTIEAFNKYTEWREKPKQTAYHRPHIYYQINSANI